LLAIEDLDGDPFPEFRVEADFAECVVMGFGEGLELDVGAF
jgi:hypothetical protein